MREILKGRSYLLLLILTCLLACVTMLWMNDAFVLNNSAMTLRNAAPYSQGWRILNDDPEQDTLSVSRENTPAYGTLVIENTLPETLCEEAALVYRINDEATRVLVDGQEIYSYGYDDHNPFGHSYGTVWLSAPLTPDMAGKTVTVEITALTDEASGGEYTFYLDQYTTIMSSILQNNSPLLLTVLAGFILAVLLLIGGLFSMHSGLQLTQPRIYLALFVFTGQCWVLAQSDILQFAIGNKAVAHFFAHTVFMLMPVFFALYLSALVQNWSRQYRRLVVFFSGYLLVRMVLYFMDILDISACTSITHALIALGVTYSVILFMIDRTSKVNPIVRLGVILFFLVAICAIIHYWMVPYLNTDMPHYALLLGIGIDTLMIFYYSALLLNHRFLASNRMRFEHQAYTDAMTQVNNRAAYDYIAPTLKPEGYPRLTLIMLDMNTLKQVNDTLGHLAGDKLVCALVNYLQLAFSAIGKIYRFGGDEFVVVIESASLDEIHAARADFDRLLQEHSQHGGNDISVAIGMASRQEREFANLSTDNLLHQADRAMYAMKTVMKSRPALFEQASQRLKQIDPQTGILTFDAFKACVYDALSAGTYAFPCIITFDLNYFDGYNNMFGWDEGDRLLQKMANMALKLCGDKGFCGHANADHFWVFADMPDLESVTNVIVSETHVFQNSIKDCLLFPSYGIYCISDTSLPVSNMCSRATSAQKRIKGRLDTLYSLYNDQEHKRRTESMQLLSFMRKALNENEFVPYYQPKFAHDGEHLVGAEALVRWPESGEYQENFIELFEQSGLILTLDWYMLERSCKELRRMLDDGMQCVPVSTNFSRLHVYETDCAERVQQLLEKYRLPANLVGIEFTSTAVAPDRNMNEKLQQLYRKLRSIGICVTLDDFNSNLSALGNIKHLNADVVKIGCRLAMDTHGLNPELSAFHFALELCRAHGIRTLVENIQTADQLAIIRRFRCDMLQGDHLSPPLTVDEFTALLAKHQPR